MHNMNNMINSVITKSGFVFEQTKINLDNDKLISIMDQLHKVNMDSDTSLEIPCPHIAVIGDQGVGKSTTLNRLLGAEILPMRQSTQQETSICTLYPTIYNTMYDNEQKEYSIEVWIKKRNENEKIYDTSIVLAHEEIKNTVKSKFAEIYSKKNLDIETMRILVKGPKLTNKYVVDLPGIRNDKSEQAISIQNHIIKYLDNNKGAIILFFLLASGPERTSAWNIINKYATSNPIIPILIKPDELGLKDRSVINILTGKTDVKFPNDNIFVIKNPNTLNGDLFDLNKIDSDEITWFKKHTIYEKYICDVDFENKMGFQKLIKKIVNMLNSQYSDILPKIIESAERKLNMYKMQQNTLKNKLAINGSNQLLLYKSNVDEFIKKIRDTLNGNISSNKILGSDIKLKIKEFYDTACNIRSTGKYTFNEINALISQSGGTRDLYTKFSEEILIYIIFKDEQKSPAKNLESLIQNYIDNIAKMFRDAVHDLEFPDSQIDMIFWNHIKEKFICNIDKKYMIDGFRMLCDAQESYYDFDCRFSKMEKMEKNDKSEKIDKNNNMNLSNITNILQLIDQVWQKYNEMIRTQFGKYIQKHFIEYNTSDAKMDSIFYNQQSIDQLVKYIKEPDDIEKRREQLDKNIAKITLLLETVNKIII